jgi:hypothetical protein
MKYRTQHISLFLFLSLCTIQLSAQDKGDEDRQMLNNRQDPRSETN